MQLLIIYIAIIYFNNARGQLLETEENEFKEFHHVKTKNDGGKFANLQTELAEKLKIENKAYAELQQEFRRSPKINKDKYIIQKRSVTIDNWSAEAEKELGARGIKDPTSNEKFLGKALVWQKAEYQEEKKKTIYAEGMRDMYEKAVAVLLCRSTLEIFKNNYLKPIADQSWNMDSKAGIEKAYQRFFNPYYKKQGIIKDMYDRIIGMLNYLELTPNEFISQNMYAYREFSNFEHMFREFCIVPSRQKTNSRLPKDIYLTREDCILILGVTPFMSEQFKSILKEIDDELYLKSS